VESGTSSSAQAVRELRRYVGVLVGASAVGLAVTAWLVPWQTFWAVGWPDWVALLLVTWIAATGLDEEPFDAVEVGTAAGFVVLGPPLAVWMAALASVLADVVRRSEGVRVGYHLGRRVLPALVAGAVYAHAVPLQSVVDVGRNALGYLAVGAVWSLVLLAVRGRYSACLTGLAVLRGLQAQARAAAAPLVVALPVGFAVASLFHTDPAAVVLLLLPALLARRLQDPSRPAGETDPVTGFDLPHRLWERLQQEMLRASRSRQPLALVVLALENLEELRRALGGVGAGSVMRDVAQAVRRELRRSDYVAHLAEDRLACVLPGATVEQAERVAARIRSEVVMRTPARVSFGVSAYTGGPQEPSAVVNAAEAAAERARRTGDRVYRG
jgi:diguanylate cyclase (GGDEF)-like protein